MPCSRTQHSVSGESRTSDTMDPRVTGSRLGLSRYIGLLVYCNISLKRYNISIRKTYHDISLLL